MRTAPLITAIVTTWFAASPLAAQTGVTLIQLTELAKSRAETLRPELAKKLEPYLEILGKSYKKEWVLIDQKAKEIQGLGDSIIPLLLEKLEPRRESPRFVNLARNCARILGEMEPASFLDSLIDIAEGENYTGIGLAIPLLGQTGSRRAGDLLTSLLGRVETLQRLACIQALTRIGHKGAALRVSKLLPFASAVDDRAAAEYLSKVKVGTTIPDILRALGEAKLSSQIMRYIRLVGACTGEDAATAKALLPYFEHKRLDRIQWSQLCDVLARVAPFGDKPTIARLKLLLKGGTTGPMELRAAIALRTLGDKTGPELLRKNLRKLTSSKKTRSYLNFANLGEFYLEFGDPKRAATTYERAVRLAMNGSLKTMLWIEIARCHAHRGRHRDVLHAIKESRADLKTLRQEAAKDPALAEMFKHASLKKYLDSFPE